ncbi:hypothetical protein E2C05_11700 [Paracraurococcus ruber]|nr:hypothetical protein E2C05_11700 [Paracraurococcus ruber]
MPPAHRHGSGPAFPPPAGGDEDRRAIHGRPPHAAPHPRRRPRHRRGPCPVAAPGPRRPGRRLPGGAQARATPRRGGRARRGDAAGDPGGGRPQGLARHGRLPAAHPPPDRAARRHRADA